eukprot:TRINITY_DN8517_c0_g1_i1.p1 TRINITY_DN8517_c0_g1~~TRINITY_DN8517_c0_g1_i1.p1  ORF type:complete len:181 (+),score=9.00 TRINITY_DN8517_c0_g1_i1:119-661(+)
MASAAWTAQCCGLYAAFRGGQDCMSSRGQSFQRLVPSNSCRLPSVGSREHGLSGLHGRFRVDAWFKFGNQGLDSEGAGIYGSQSRDEFDRDDVEQYFNYMGMLATEGTYDKMEALLNKGIHPVDILLLLAASEGDKPKIQELLRAGARCDVTDVEGRTALERASGDDIKELISQGAIAVV